MTNANLPSVAQQLGAMGHALAKPTKAEPLRATTLSNTPHRQQVRNRRGDPE